MTQGYQHGQLFYSALILQSFQELLGNRYVFKYTYIHNTCILNTPILLHFLSCHLSFLLVSMQLILIFLISYIVMSSVFSFFFFWFGNGPFFKNKISHEFQHTNWMNMDFCCGSGTGSQCPAAEPLYLVFRVEHWGIWWNPRLPSNNLIPLVKPKSDFLYSEA